MVKEFIGRDKTRASRKLLDYWYRNFLGIFTIKKFLSMCVWKDSNNEVIIIYHGPPPSRK